MAGARGRTALDEGKPLPMALREARVWGPKERLFERLLPRLPDHQIAHLLEAGSTCDGICKGLKHPEWPNDPWAALQRWILMLMRAPHGQQSQQSQQWQQSQPAGPRRSQAFQ